MPAYLVLWASYALWLVAAWRLQAVWMESSRHAYVLSGRVVLFVRAQGLYVPPGCQHSPRKAEPRAMSSAMVQKDSSVEQCWHTRPFAQAVYIQAKDSL